MKLAAESNIFISYLYENLYQEGQPQHLVAGLSWLKAVIRLIYLYNIGVSKSTYKQICKNCSQNELRYAMINIADSTIIILFISFDSPNWAHNIDNMQKPPKLTDHNRFNIKFWNFEYTKHMVVVNMIDFCSITVKRDNRCIGHN